MTNLFAVRHPASMDADKPPWSGSMVGLIHREALILVACGRRRGMIFVCGMKKKKRHLESVLSYCFRSLNTEVGIRVGGLNVTVRRKRWMIAGSKKHESRRQSQQRQRW